MLTMTQPAAAFITQTRERNGIPADATLRVAGASSDGSPNYSIGFVDEPISGDSVGEAHGVPLCVDPDVTEALDDFAIDVVRDDDGTRLVMVPAG
jgi:Fe-S cluster assembly iron-binding protein IscA